MTTETPLLMLSADDVYDALYANHVDGEHRTYPAETVSAIIASDAAECFGGEGSRQEIAEKRLELEQAYARGVRLQQTHLLVCGPVCDVTLPYRTAELTYEYGDRIASVPVQQLCGYIGTNEQHCAVLLVRKATRYGP